MQIERCVQHTTDAREFFELAKKRLKAQKRAKEDARLLKKWMEEAESEPYQGITDDEMNWQGLDHH